MAGFLGFLQFVVFVVAALLTYDFLHDHYGDAIAWLQGGNGGLGDFANWLPAMPWLINVVLILGVIVLFFVIGHNRRLLRRPGIRTPSGRTEY